MKSGRAWWNANQSRYPNSRDIGDLHAGFQEDVRSFVNVLRDAGAKVRIRSTRRNVIRAYLMHYSWRIANREIESAEVPSRHGVNIQWDHGTDRDSRRAAREMVNLFNIAYRPSLRSNHIKGKAIDMRITWRGDLFLGPLPDGSFRGIDGPRNGARNRQLHEIGALFGVRKLLKDRPHWSQNGR